MITRINITKKTLTTQLGLLSNDVRLFMVLPSSDRYYGLNDRTINILMKGKINTNAAIGGPDGPTFSNAEMNC